MKKLALQMAMATTTPVNFYLDMTVPEMCEYADLIQEIQRKK